MYLSGVAKLSLLHSLFILPFFLVLNSMFPKTILSAQAFENEFVFANGAGWGYLRRLPEWPEQREK